MKRAGKLVGALIALTFSAGVAVAADIPEVVVAVAPAPPAAPPPPPTFNWGGVYVGVHMGYYDYFECGLADLECDALEPGVQFGFNIVAGKLLFGAEGNIGVFWNPIFEYDSPVFMTAIARGGFIAGDNLLVYLEGGIWRYIFPPGPWDIGFVGGLGLEYVVAEPITVFGEAKAFMFNGNLDRAVWFQVGVNYHLGH